MPYDDGGWPDYVSVAEQRQNAARVLAKLRKGGQKPAPVQIEGRKITNTFWGKAWCHNLESYRDYESRLPRGRSYARNGFVVDLQIGPREVRALVSGSSLYKVTIGIAPVPKPQWREICADCAGRIDSVVELLQGRLSKGVMERICRQGEGLFPKPAEIRFLCTCLDHASMCKHVAAVLYGVGARLDQSPELLFLMRAVDHQDLLARLDDAMPAAGAHKARVLAEDDLSALFGLDLGTPVAADKALRAMAAAIPAASRRGGAPAKPRAANIKDIADQLAASSGGMDKKRAEKLVTDVVGIIADRLAAGSDVTLAGLGTLGISERDVRYGRNPATGDQIRIVGKREWMFRPAKKVKDAV